MRCSSVRRDVREIRDALVTVRGGWKALMLIVAISAIAGRGDQQVRALRLLAPALVSSTNHWSSSCAIPWGSCPCRAFAFSVTCRGCGALISQRDIADRIGLHMPLARITTLAGDKAKRFLAAYNAHPPRTNLTGEAVMIIDARSTGAGGLCGPVHRRLRKGRRADSAGTYESILAQLGASPRGMTMQITPGRTGAHQALRRLSRGGLSRRSRRVDDRLRPHFDGRQSPAVRPARITRNEAAAILERDVEAFAKACASL